MITSAQNSMIKKVRALSKKRDRVKTGQFVAEGYRFVKSAVDNRADIECILYSESALRADACKAFVENLEQDGQVKIFEIEEKLMLALADTQSPQGILAIVKQSSWVLEDILKEKGFVLVLDRIQDPGNLGTIIRTADAAGVDGIILLKGTVDIYNPKVLRSTMGSVFDMPIIEGVLWEDIMPRLKEQKYLITATALENSIAYDEVDYNSSVAMVIGNEASGVSEEIIKQSDRTVKIPILGKAESLNAGVAAAVMMYEVVRQRKTVG